MELGNLTDATIQSLIQAGRDLAAPVAVQQVDGLPVPFIVKNGEVKLLPELKYNEHAARPERIKQNVSVYDADSFGNYYTLFFDENSRVFADEAKRNVLAILDYHAAGDGAARWGQHRVTLVLRDSEEWTRWTRKNNQHMTQQEFAEFLEQNGMDITAPAPASIREIAEDLEATVDVDFGSAQRQAGGKVAFKYTETTKTTTSGGKAVVIPDQFTISIPAFVGGIRVSVQVLLRYRIKEQRLVFFYTLVRPEQVVRDAFLGCRNAIQDSLKIAIINGSTA